MVIETPTPSNTGLQKKCQSTPLGQEKSPHSPLGYSWEESTEISGRPLQAKRTQRPHPPFTAPPVGREDLTKKHNSAPSRLGGLWSDIRAPPAGQEDTKTPPLPLGRPLQVRRTSQGRITAPPARWEDSTEISGCPLQARRTQRSHPPFGAPPAGREDPPQTLPTHRSLHSSRRRSSRSRERS